MHLHLHRERTSADRLALITAGRRNFAGAVNAAEAVDLAGVVLAAGPPLVAADHGADAAARLEALVTRGHAVLCTHTPIGPPHAGASANGSVSICQQVDQSCGTAQRSAANGR